MTSAKRQAVEDMEQTEVRIPIDSMDVITRTPDAGRAESNFEKVVVLPNRDDKDPSNHAWADARFATDILSEHGLFFALLMPEELAKEERAEALGFYREFGEMHRQVAAAKPPARSEVKPFLGKIREKALHRVQAAPRRRAEGGQASQPGVASVLRPHAARGRALESPL